MLRVTMQVVPGQATEIFKRHPMPQFARLSFSLIYTEDKDNNEPRTLDLTCKNEQEFMLWFWGIQVTHPHGLASCFFIVVRIALHCVCRLYCTFTA